MNNVIDLGVWRQKQAEQKARVPTDDGQTDALYIGADEARDEVILGITGAEFTVQLTEEGAFRAAELLMKGVQKLRMRRYERLRKQQAPGAPPAPLQESAEAPRWLPTAVTEQPLKPLDRVFELMPDPPFLAGWRFGAEADAASRWERAVTNWWHHGDNLAIVAKPGIDVTAAWSHLRAVALSTRPDHNHKLRALAYLASCWFEGPP